MNMHASSILLLLYIAGCVSCHREYTYHIPCDTVHRPAGGCYQVPTLPCFHIPTESVKITDVVILGCGLGIDNIYISKWRPLRLQSNMHMYSWLWLFHSPSLSSHLSFPVALLAIIKSAIVLPIGNAIFNCKCCVRRMKMKIEATGTRTPAYSQEKQVQLNCSPNQNITRTQLYYFPTNFAQKKQKSSKFFCRAAANGDGGKLFCQWRRNERTMCVIQVYFFVAVLAPTAAI